MSRTAQFNFATAAKMSAAAAAVATAAFLSALTTCRSSSMPRPSRAMSITPCPAPK
jgi:hypothetical protein